MLAGRITEVREIHCIGVGRGVAPGAGAPP